MRTASEPKYFLVQADMYNDAVLQNRDLRAEYTQKYGMLTSNHCVSAVPWQWIDSPWPWQKAANFELREENA